jgi:hypothetical protein
VTLHLVLRSMDALDVLPVGSWIGILRRDRFTPYAKDEDGTWWKNGAWAVELDPDDLFWGARILYIPEDTEVTAASSELDEDDPIAAAAAVIARAEGTAFVGPDHRRAAAALAAAGLLAH